MTHVSLSYKIHLFFNWFGTKVGCRWSYGELDDLFYFQNPFQDDAMISRSTRYLVKMSFLFLTPYLVSLIASGNML